MNPRTLKLIVLSPFILLAFVLFVAAGGWIVKLLWNGLLPALFGFPAVTFWQALGLLVLCRILFGGFGMHGGGRSRSRGRMFARWDSMTPEERERFRQKMRGRFGFEPPASGDAAP